MFHFICDLQVDGWAVTDTSLQHTRQRKAAQSQEEVEIPTEPRDCWGHCEKKSQCLSCIVRRSGKTKANASPLPPVKTINKALKEYVGFP